jgi:hypothetical protein
MRILSMIRVGEDALLFAERPLDDNQWNANVSSDLMDACKQGPVIIASELI